MYLRVALNPKHSEGVGRRVMMHSARMLPSGAHMFCIVLFFGFGSIESTPKVGVPNCGYPCIATRISDPKLAT